MLQRSNRWFALILLMGMGVICPALADTRPQNISTGGVVETGDDTLIGGLIITDTEPKAVVIRARGPSMTAADPNLIGLLEDPYVQLFSGATLTVQNDDWALDAGVNDLRSDLRPTSTKEAAITTTLAPGAYTAIVRGVNQSVGIGIVEVLEVD